MRIKMKKMKKILFTAALMSAIGINAAAQNIPVRLNQSGELLDGVAVSEEGKLYLPLHDIVYATGDRVRYDSQRDTAYLTDNGSEYACFYTTVPDADFAFEQYEAKKINGVFYISPESYVKIFGGSVAWDKEENIVDITEKDYKFGLEEIHLFRPAETVVKTDAEGNIYLEVCEEYSETMPLNRGAGEYEIDVEEGRIPVVSILKTYYGIDYTITQAFRKRPVATVKLTRGNETYIYTIHFKECTDK